MPPFQRSAGLARFALTDRGLTSPLLQMAAAKALGSPKEKPLTLEDAFSKDVPVSLTEFLELERQTRHTRAQADTEKFIREITAEAFTARAKESTTGEQGIFEGAKEQRDAIIGFALEEGVTEDQKLANIVGQVRILIDKSNQKLGRLQGEITVAERERDMKVRLSELFSRLADLEAAGGYKLQSNDCARVHRVYEAFRLQKIGGAVQGSDKVTKIMNMRNDFMPFIVRHDWSAVLADSDGDVDGEALLPAPLCAFEFRISGLNVIVLCVEPNDESNINEFLPGQRRVVFVEAADDWWITLDPNLRLAQYALNQVHAACIMLEVDVVSTTLIKAPDALNKKRAKQGKLPLSSFHVLDLDKNRRRNSTSNRGDGTGTPRRFHFSRAHNRTYQDGRTIRVKWSFKGNIDLGVVDKTYRL